MRIAINTRFLLKNSLEGIGLFTHEVVRRLVQELPQHEFIFFFDRPFDPSFIYGKNVKPVVLFPPARHPFLFLWWYEWSVARALKKYKADVFLSPDNFLSLRTQVKTVLVTHDLAQEHYPEQIPFLHRKYYQFFSKKFNHRADRIVTVSRFTRDDLVKRYGIPQGKISIACNGCRAFFKPLGEVERQHTRQKYSGGMPYFLYVGAVHPRKNVHRLIAAFDLFKKNTGAPLQLLIVGRFAWKAGAVQDAWRVACHQPEIHFLGYVEDGTLAALTGAAFASTYVSLFEGFGVPVLEAMHCDVPSITSNVSSLPEVVGKAGLKVNPESVEEIAGAMQRLWEDESLYQALVAQGRQQRKKFSWQKATEVVREALTAKE